MKNRLLKIAALITAISGLSSANATDISYNWNDTLQGSSDPNANNTLCGTYAMPTIKTGMAALWVELDGLPGELTAVVHKTSDNGAVVDTLVSPSNRSVKLTSTAPIFIELQCQTGQAKYATGRFRIAWNTTGKKLYVPSIPGTLINIYDKTTGSFVTSQTASVSSGLAVFTLNPGSYYISAYLNGAEVWYGTNSVGKPRDSATYVSMSTTDKVAGLIVSDRPVITGAAIDPVTKKLVITGTGFGDDIPGYVENFVGGKSTRSTISNTTTINWTDTQITASAAALGVDRCARVFSPQGGWTKECFRY